MCSSFFLPGCGNWTCGNVQKADHGSSLGRFVIMDRREGCLLLVLYSPSDFGYILAMNTETSLCSQ